MKVSVDDELCIASHQCELFCPEVFVVGETARVKVEIPDPVLHSAVRHAADACPSGAISLDKDVD